MGNRRRPWLVGLGLVVAMLFTACTPDGQPPPAAKDSAATGPILLQMDVYGPPQVITAYTKIAADFTAQNPQIVVNVRPFDNHARAMRALHRRIGEGRPPNLFLADVGDLPALQRRGIIRRVDDLLGARQVDFGDGFVRAALEDFSADAQLKCMPLDFSPLVVYYNTDLVHPGRLADPGTGPVDAEHGWSLAEFAKAARRASRHGHKGLYIAPTLEQIAPFVRSGGGELVDNTLDPTTLTLAGGNSEQAMVKLLELVRRPRLTYGPAQLARKPALERFETGRLAMLLGFRRLTPRLRSQQGLHFDVMPLPRLGTRATVAASNGMCVVDGAGHLEATGDFLAYLASDEAMTVLAETGYVVPTSLDVSSSPAFTQPGEAPAHPEVFTTQARYARLLPRTPQWKQMSRAAAGQLQQLFYDKVIDPVDERLESLDEQSARILAPPTPSGAPSPSGDPDTPATN